MKNSTQYKKVIKFGNLSKLKRSQKSSSDATIKKKGRSLTNITLQAIKHLDDLITRIDKQYPLP